MPQFTGKVIFLENYDIEMAKYLVRGVDIWLNTPTRPMEASGLAGKKQ
jgi:glucan phosphorylase